MKAEVTGVTAWQGTPTGGTLSIRAPRYVDSSGNASPEEYSAVLDVTHNPPRWMDALDPTRKLYVIVQGPDDPVGVRARFYEVLHYGPTKSVRTEFTRKLISSDLNGLIFDYAMPEPTDIPVGFGDAPLTMRAAQQVIEEGGAVVSEWSDIKVDIAQAQAQILAANGRIAWAGGDHTTLPNGAGDYLITRGTEAGQVWTRATNGATPQRNDKLEALSAAALPVTNVKSGDPLAGGAGYNSTAALTAALTAAATGSGTAYLPGATYTHGVGSLNALPLVTLRGAGPRLTTLQASAAGVSIGNNSATSAKWLGVSDLRAFGVSATEIPTDGSVGFDSGNTAFPRLNRLELARFQTGVILSGDGANGTYFANITDVDVIGAKVGVQLGKGTGTSSNTHVLTNFRVLNSETGIWLNGNQFDVENSLFLGGDVEHAEVGILHNGTASSRIVGPQVFVGTRFEDVTNLFKSSVTGTFTKDPGKLMFLGANFTSTDEELAFADDNPDASLVLNAAGGLKDASGQARQIIPGSVRLVHYAPNSQADGSVSQGGGLHLWNTALTTGVLRYVPGNGVGVALEEVRSYTRRSSDGSPILGQVFQRISTAGLHLFPNRAGWDMTSRLTFGPYHLWRDANGDIRVASTASPHTAPADTDGDAFAWRTKLQTFPTRQIFGGGGAALTVQASASVDHAYLNFFARSGNTTTESGKIGYTSNGSNDLIVDNNAAGDTRVNAGDATKYNAPKK